MRPPPQQHCSALRGREQHIFNLVWNHATPEQWSSWLVAPLQHAAVARDLGTVARLLKAGADADGVEDVVCELLMSSPTSVWDGDSSLHLATALDCIDHRHVLEMLVAKGADPNAQDSEGRAPLRLAVEYDLLPAVKALLEAGAEVGVRHAGDDCCALDLASGEGHLHIMRELLTHGADANGSDARGYTALHRAAFYDKACAVGLLVEAGANLGARDGVGFTPFHDACAEGSIESLQTLLKLGANPRTLDRSGRSPLHLAAERGHVLVVEALLAAGTDVSLRFGRTECSALDFAAIEGHVGVMEVIVPHVIDINAAASDGRTALHRAAFFDQAAAIDILVEAGADLEARDNGYGWTALHDASSEGSSGAVACLVRHGANKDAVDSEGRAPLHLIAEAGQDGGYIPAAKTFLAAGADCGLRYGESELSPLEVAVRESHLEIVEEIIQHWDINSTDSRGFTALHHAAYWDEDSAVEVLVQRGADAKALDRDGATPLHAAATAGSAESAVVLLRHGADPNAVDGDGSSPLHLAAEYGHLYTVVSLLDGGADPNLRNGGGWSALDLAAVKGFLRVVREFVRFGGVGLNAADYQGYAALHRAAFANTAEVVDVLAQAGADVEATDTAGWTPLHVAAAEGSPDAALALLRHGANQDRQDLEGRSPLHLAAERGFFPTTEYLLRAGADTGVRFGKSESTALDFAAVEGHLEVLGAIIRGGADIHAVDSGGRTVLHRAAFFNQASAIDILVEAGASVTETDGTGRTPLDVASVRGSQEAAAALEKHGAIVDPPEISTSSERRVSSVACQVVGTETPPHTRVRQGSPSDSTKEGECASDTALKDVQALVDAEALVARLAKESAAEAWRRRGLLVMCRAYPDRVVSAPSSSGLCKGKGRVLCTCGLSAAGDDGQEAECRCPGSDEGSARTRPLSRRKSDVTRDVGGDAAGWVLRLEEEGLFRNIVAFL